MRPLYITQGSSIEVFYRMHSVLQSRGVEYSGAWFVADQASFDRFQGSENKKLLHAPILKEWEIVAEALRHELRVGQIRKWEEFLNLDTLWPAVVADRRLFMGKSCKAVQDYRPRYKQEQLESILVSLCEAFLKVFIDQRPDVVFSFGPNTAGAMVAAFMARRHGLPFLTMKATKISNLVSFSEDWVDRHPHIQRLFECFADPAAIPRSASQFATAYLQEAKEGGELKYEGVLAREHPSINTRWGEVGRHGLGIIRGLVSDACFLASGRFDPQRSPQITMQYHLGFGRKFRILRTKSIISHATIHKKELGEMDFLFFPLNSEPEIALSVNSRQYRNQIEVARNLAESLPMGMRLVIKDHPRSWGVRKPGYYRKLLEIPNLRIAPVEMQVSEIIKNAKAVAVLSSFVGFEALICNKPVILFGSCIYDFLPPPLVWRVRSLEDLPKILTKACDVKLNGKELIHRFIAAVKQGAVPVDLYSSMLKKSNRLKGTTNISLNLEKQYTSLGEYAWRRFEESLAARKINTEADLKIRENV